ncbi:MAG: GNAT family N-acetyltransferase [Burkholderiales bacterium]
MLIHTPNLRLFTCTAEHLEAIVRDPASLGTLLNASIAEGWPNFPPAYPRLLEALKQDPMLVWSGWGLYLFVEPEKRALIGCGGFRGPPDQEGVVEVGCEIAPAHRGHGYAAEATRGLLRYAFTRPEVLAVDARTMPERAACARVLEKAGMRLLGKERDPHDGPIWRWRITRDEYQGKQRKAA